MSTDTTDSQTMPAAGRAPAAPPAAGYIGALLAVLLIAAGCIAMRDACIAAGWLGGPLWIDAAIDWIDGLEFTGWMIAAGIALVLLGAWMLYSAVRPRRTTALQLDARSAVWIRPADLARAASATAHRVPGVLEATSRATRRTLVITAHTTDPANPDIAAQTQHAVRTSVAQGLANEPNVVVRVRKAER